MKVRYTKIGIQRSLNKSIGFRQQVPDLCFDIRVRAATTLMAAFPLNHIHLQRFSHS